MEVSNYQWLTAQKCSGFTKVVNNVYLFQISSMFLSYLIFLIQYMKHNILYK